MTKQDAQPTTPLDSIEAFTNSALMFLEVGDLTAVSVDLNSILSALRDEQQAQADDAAHDDYYDELEKQDAQPITLSAKDLGIIENALINQIRHYRRTLDPLSIHAQRTLDNVHATQKQAQDDAPAPFDIDAHVLALVQQHGVISVDRALDRASDAITLRAQADAPATIADMLKRDIAAAKDMTLHDVGGILDRMATSETPLTFDEAQADAPNARAYDGAQAAHFRAEMASDDD